MITLNCLLTKNGFEKLVVLTTESDRFCEVVQVLRQQHPGWSLVETW